MPQELLAEWSPVREEAQSTLIALDGALSTLYSAPALPPDLLTALIQAQAAAAQLRRLLGMTTLADGRVLVLDDNSTRASILGTALVEAGYYVETALDAVSVFTRIATWRPQLILLAIRHVQDDPQLLQRLRAAGEAIIILLAGRLAGRAASLMAQGADDYLTEPLTPGDIVARVSASLRRDTGSDTRLEYGPLRIDISARAVMLEGHLIRLTPIEYSLLYHLTVEAGRILTHQQLLERVWGEAYTDSSDYLWVHLSRLRRKLNLPNQPSLIITERGMGYRLRPLRG